jgi:hypothetical protein
MPNARAIFMLFAVAGAAGSAHGIILNSSLTGPSATGANLGLYLGAGTFYAAGYTGSRTTVANIEGGQPWLGHQTLGHVGLMPLYAGTQTSVQDHATGVTQVLGGRGTLPHRQGIAPDAALYAGTVNKLRDVSIAFDAASVGRTYDAAMHGFVPQGGSVSVRADVINSSWGRIGTYTGYDPIVEQMEGLIRRSGTVVVAAAGNSGPRENQFGPPGVALNVITVGALESLTPPEVAPAYDRVASFSSVSPTNVIFLGQSQTLTRAAISLVAPGKDFTVAGYNGPGTVPNWYYGGRSGTSYASPTVAGAAALLVDVGYHRFVTASDRTAIDSRTVRAVLMNSADKIPGWNNAQSSVSGVVTTTQALDYAAGAGRLNMDRAFHQYTSGTAGIDLTGDAASVLPTGWDFERLLPGSAATYSLAGQLPAGTILTTTLTWFLDATYEDADDTAAITALADLSLEVLHLGPEGASVVARSDTLRNNVEHLHIALESSGEYALRVLFDGAEFGSAVPTDFAVAWNTTAIPEPATVSAVVTLLFGLATRRRRST